MSLRQIPPSFSPEVASPKASLDVVISGESDVEMYPVDGLKTIEITKENGGSMGFHGILWDLPSGNLLHSYGKKARGIVSFPIEHCIFP